MNDSRRCTAQRPDGTFCERDGIPGAPFPICLKHAAQVLGFVRDSLSAADEEGVVAGWFRRLERTEQPRAATASVVYYVRVGDLIKIGTTGDIRGRMQAYPPNAELLGCEPGGVGLERQRLAEFARSRRAGREWFEATDSILRHIQALPPLGCAA